MLVEAKEEFESELKRVKQQTEKKIEELTAEKSV